MSSEELATIEGIPDQDTGFYEWLIAKLGQRDIYLCSWNQEMSEWIPLSGSEVSAAIDHVNEAATHP